VKGFGNQTNQTFLKLVGPRISSGLRAKSAEGGTDKEKKVRKRTKGT